MSEVPEQPRTDREELKEVIKEFLSHYKYLYEKRIQKLVFYGEVYCLTHYDRRLTDASWKPYMYGSFSDDVRDVVRELDVPKKFVFKNGQQTTVYLNRGLDGGNLHKAKKDVIGRIHARTITQSTSDLANFTKKHWLFQNANYDEDMDFEAYMERIDDIPIEHRPLYDPDAPIIDEISDEVLFKPAPA